MSWYLTMFFYIRQINITRIKCNRTLTIARITRQESHRELISLVSCTIRHTQSVAEPRSSSRWPCKEKSLWQILLREQLNICCMLEYLLLFSATRMTKTTRRGLFKPSSYVGNIEHLAICFEISVLHRFRLPFRIRWCETRHRAKLLDVKWIFQNCSKIHKSLCFSIWNNIILEIKLNYRNIKNFYLIKTILILILQFFIYIVESIFQIPTIYNNSS